jgi:hypothetical protein
MKEKVPSFYEVREDFGGDRFRLKVRFTLSAELQCESKFPSRFDALFACWEESATLNVILSTRKIVLQFLP